jgi:hypothetical protein
MLGPVKATEIYYTNRTYTAIEFGNQINRPADLVNAEASRLTDIVQGEIILDSNETYAIEKQAAIPVCYESAAAAWDSALNYSGTPSNYYGKIYENVGWVRGTKSTGSEWGAYLWVLQNKITFQTSTSYWWTITNNLTVAITNVYVGSLGIYGPMESNVVDIGPEIPTNFPGEDQSDTAEYRVDITNIYYQLVIPAVWITPRDVVVEVGNTNAIRFTVTGTNLTNGVTWALEPDLSGSGGATMQSNNWYSRDVYPGNVATSYIVRAASVNNTNFYDQVLLNVLKVEVTELSFADDYSIYAVTDPVWKKENYPNYSACYQKSNSLSMNVKLAITPSLPSSATISLRADGPGDLDAQKDNISISGSEGTVNDITTTGKLDDKIYSASPSISWSFSLDGANWYSAGTSGPHKVYAIYNSPTCGSANFTTSHIDDAVGWAFDQISESNIAHEVMCNVNGGISTGCICNASFEYIWQGARGYHNDGMCCCRATGMSEVMQVLGVPGYTTIVYVNERPEPGVKGPNPDEPGEYCTNCVSWCYRGAWWGGFWNNWEGACRSHDAGSICYAPAGSPHFDGTYNQIRNTFGPYYWVWGTNQSDICTHLPPP